MSEEEKESVPVMDGSNDVLVMMVSGNCAAVSAL